MQPAWLATEQRSPETSLAGVPRNLKTHNRYLQRVPVLHLTSVLCVPSHVALCACLWCLRRGQIPRKGVLDAKVDTHSTLLGIPKYIPEMVLSAPQIKPILQTWDSTIWTALISTLQDFLFFFFALQVGILGAALICNTDNKIRDAVVWTEGIKSGQHTRTLAWLPLGKQFLWVFTACFLLTVFQQPQFRNKQKKKPSVSNKRLCYQ